MCLQILNSYINILASQVYDSQNDTSISCFFGQQFSNYIILNLKQSIKNADTKLNQRKVLIMCLFLR